MSEEKKHFSAGGNMSHSGVFILPGGQDIEYIVIDRIEWREQENVNGQKKDVFVAVFAPNPYTTLPFVLNKENKSRILKAAKKGEWDLLEVKNLPVRLTHEDTKLGEGLRVSKLPPKIPTAPAPKKNVLTEDKLGPAVAFLRKPDGTMEKLRESYDISAEIEAKINEMLKDNGPEGA